LDGKQVEKAEESHSRVLCLYIYAVLKWRFAMDPIRFSIIGGGYRTGAYLQIAHALPDRFQVDGMFVRDAAKGQELEARWHVKAYRTLDELLRASRPHFVVLSLPRSVTPIMLGELAERGMPALTETPPAPDLPGLLAVYELVRRGARIQVAEQYHLQPLHAARLAIVRSGKLGAVSQVQLSVAHDYHAISLMRKLLNIGFEDVTVSAHRFVSPLVAGPDRSGPPDQEKIVQSTQVLAYLDFGDKFGVYDFCNDQYRSWIRSLRVLVRGDRGEIDNTQVHYLADFRTPVNLELMRQDAGENGNLEGFYHKGFLAGSEWVYQNPIAPARLNDDEIAIATCLDKMAEYVAGGPDFYSVAEAAQDHYVSLMIHRALAAQETVRTTVQPWARA
jgi:predicted dehydrogenase